MLRITWAITTFLIPLFLTGCQSDEQQRMKAVNLPTVEVQVAKVSARQSHQQTEVVGTVRPVNQAVIAAKVTGSIVEMPVLLGSIVKEGDLLVKISAGEISAQVVQTQARLEQARRNLEREKKLLKKNAATAENVKSLEDMYRVAEAVHNEALTMLSYTTINAPFDGVVTSKMANIGDLATPGSPLLRLEDNSKLQVEASVPEALVLQVRPEESLAIHIPAAEIYLKGMVAEVAPATDPLSRTATIKINIEPYPQLRSGQFARVSIPGAKHQALYVPTASLHAFGQMDRLFVFTENRAHLRLVRAGETVGDQSEILAGLDPGEIIITSSSSPLVDNQPVHVVQ